MLDFKLQTSASAVGFLFVEFSKIYYCIVTKHTRQDAFKFFLCCNFYWRLITTGFLTFFFILCCTEVPRLVETCLWLVKPEHVLAIWLFSSKVKFEPWHEVAQWLSERQSLEVDLFCRNGFDLNHITYSRGEKMIDICCVRSSVKNISLTVPVLVNCHDLLFW